MLEDILDGYTMNYMLASARTVRSHIDLLLKVVRRHYLFRQNCYILFNVRSILLNETSFQYFNMYSTGGHNWASEVLSH